MNCCPIQFYFERFMSINPTEREIVYLMIKDQPYVKEAYEKVKREQKK